MFPSCSVLPHSGTAVSVCPSALLEAVRINAKGQQVLYLAQGDSVRLGCPYILEPEDNGPTNLDIIWTMVNPDQRLPFLTYQDQRIRYGSAPGLQQRVSFVAQDPSLYDASILLANLQMSDSATYECRVKKATVDTHQVTVTVLEKPAAPRCWMDGEPVRGGDLMLRCCSDGGSLPLSYQWSKMGGDYPPLGNVYYMSFRKSWHPGDPFHGWSSQGVFGGGPRHGPDGLPGGSGCPALSQGPLGVEELAPPVGGYFVGAHSGLGLSCAGQASGDLMIQSLSQEHSGTYCCRVTNRVGYTQCMVRVSVPRAGYTGRIGGTRPGQGASARAPSGAGPKRLAVAP
uniref:V-set and immunoglobulin domain containing 8 n=1 Tax=Terrapene triunguis TaxID=2587831 RepID=A0A674IKR6_9SAUR